MAAEGAASPVPPRTPKRYAAVRRVVLAQQCCSVSLASVSPRLRAHKPKPRVELTSERVREVALKRLGTSPVVHSYSLS